MIFDYARLAEITALPNSAGSVYTNPASTSSYVKLIQLHNTSTVNEIVSLYNVPDAAGTVGTASTANRFFNYTMAPNETIQVEYNSPGLVLKDENDTIQAAASTAAKVNIEIYGGLE